ncbi:Fcf2-domain-containing protein [Meredithblackwellia eburnea MCA 4105]
MLSTALNQLVGWTDSNKNNNNDKLQEQPSITSTLVSSNSLPSSISTKDDHSSSDSDSGSEDSDSDESDSDISEGEEDQETNERLKDLFLKAKQSARERQTLVAQLEGVSSSKSSAGDTLAGQDEMVLFGDEDDEEEDVEDSEESPEDGENRATPKPSTSKSASSKQPLLSAALTRPLILSAPTSSSSSVFSSIAMIPQKNKGKGKELARGITLAQDLAGASIEDTNVGGKGEKWGKGPTPKLSKKERLARKPRTAGPQWFNMPATELTPEVKREIQAMKMRNALDPKRFYKGGAKDDKSVPEFFSLGHILPSSHSASTSLPAVARKRTFIEELMDDDQAKSYTKRKTAEVMERGMSGRKRQKKNARQKSEGGKQRRKGK